MSCKIPAAARRLHLPHIQIVLILALTSAHVVQMSHVVPVIKVVSQNVNELGEGPYYDAANKILYHVDAVGGDFVRVDPATGNVQKVHLNGGLVSIIIPYADDPNSFIVSFKNQLHRLNWTTGKTELFAEVSPELKGAERFNDGKCDPRGRLFIGTVLEQNGVVPNGGALYRLDGNNFTEVARGFSISNGMAWSNDANHTKLYFNDSEGRKIYSFNYDIETGALSNQTVMIDCDKSEDFVPGEYPDGMLIDKYGYIWVAMYAGGRIVKIDVDTARVVDQVVLKPRVKVPSSLAPGDYQGVDGFFVTTAATGINGEDRIDDGKTLHISFQGGEVYKFKP